MGPRAFFVAILSLLVAEGMSGVDPIIADPRIPVVITTWNYIEATEKAWDVIGNQGRSALDAVEEGCSLCEAMQCRGTVGYGGSPDENGETTLDAMIMDGVTMDAGGVGALRRVRSAISVARKVMEHTTHTLLAGSQATDFALRMGFEEETLGTNKSQALWWDWKLKDCQPNSWRNVRPDPAKHCGPYTPKPVRSGSGPGSPRTMFAADAYNHDTIGMAAVDAQGRVAAGTSTNGKRNKIPGRVGDSPIPGAGAFADQEVGAAAATGDGDIMMRFLPTFLAVELMRHGATPKQAADEAVGRMKARYPDFSGAVIALRKDGQYAASCHNLPTFPQGFPLTLRNGPLGNVTIQYYPCI